MISIPYYKINHHADFFEYDANTDTILIANRYLKYLNPDEQIKLSADSLTHEFMHHLFKELFEYKMCRIYDVISHYFLKYPKLQQKWLNIIKDKTCRVVTTHETSIILRGFDNWLRDIKHMDKEDIKKLNEICNKRGEK